MTCISARAIPPGLRVTSDGCEFGARVAAVPICLPGRPASSETPGNPDSVQEDAETFLNSMYWPTDPAAPDADPIETRRLDDEQAELAEGAPAEAGGAVADEDGTAVLVLEAPIPVAGELAAEHPASTAAATPEVARPVADFRPRRSVMSTFSFRRGSVSDGCYYPGCHTERIGWRKDGETGFGQRPSAT